MEFTAADIFQHSPFGDMLNSLKSLSLSGDSWPNYVRLEWEVGDKEISFPHTTHFIATVDDVTYMLDFDSDDTDGMDVGAGDDLEPPPTGRWTATSSYDIYMVDTPKEDSGNKKDTTGDKTPGQKPKQRRRRRSKSSNSKNSDNSARKIDTPVNSESNNDHMNPAME